MAIVLCTGGNIRRVAFTVNISDTGTDRVAFDIEVGIMVTVLV